jgi:hypothetical protein
MKNALQWTCVLAGAAFIGWCHAHTDEVPVVLGIILILSTFLSLVFPRWPWLTGFLLGAPVFLVETLVHFSVIHAPYPPSSGLPWAALLGFVPAMGGAFFGSAIRHLNSQRKHAG